MPTLRVLCLHGFRTNVQVMQDQMRPLEQALGPDVEFVYLNGPYETEGKAFAGIDERYKDSRPFYEWYRYYIGDSTQSFEMAPKDLVLLRNKVREEHVHWSLRYSGIEQAIEYLDARLEALGPFDVAIGFSQGGLMLTVYAMWCLENRNKRPWKLAVMSSTGRAHGYNVKHLFEAPDGREILVPFPSVHLVGKKDPIRDQSLRLVPMYDPHPTGTPTGRVVLEHEEGHRFPSLKRNKELYATVVSVMNQYRSSSASAAASRL
ncbi:hypothetical protein PybrP1_006364 [[Pythium] brassicae (nom. inval.)]|nr:hypothetical protein PybrP1_006364 [[Pythium] brassicae (nom. inval.)]